MINLVALQSVSEVGLSNTTIIVIVVAVIGLILVPILLSVRRDFVSLAQARTLLAEGEPAQAKILKLRDTGTTLNDNPKVELLLEVHPRDRAAYRVETKCYVSRLRISQVQTGAFVAVKIDPQDITKVALDLA
jgi:hypothetical protein